VSSPSVGAILIMLGLGLAVVGLLVWAGAFGWFGRLPGDIRIERGTVHVYIPIVSMLVVSIVLTLLLNLLSRFFE
jgi:Zn-dependent protease with chaperone function